MTEHTCRPGYDVCDHPDHRKPVNPAHNPTPEQLQGSYNNMAMYVNGERRPQDPDEREHVADLIEEAITGASVVVLRRTDEVGPMGGRSIKLVILFKADDEWHSAVANVYDGVQCNIDIEALLAEEVEQNERNGRIDELVQKLS